MLASSGSLVKRAIFPIFIVLLSGGQDAAINLTAWARSDPEALQCVRATVCLTKWITLASSNAIIIRSLWWRSLGFEVAVNVCTTLHTVLLLWTNGKFLNNLVVTEHSDIESRPNPGRLIIFASVNFTLWTNAFLRSVALSFRERAKFF